MTKGGIREMYHCCTSNRTAHWFNGAVRLYLAVFHYMDNFRFCHPGLPPLLRCCPESSYASKCCPGHACLEAHSCSYTAPGLGFWQFTYAHILSRDFGNLKAPMCSYAFQESEPGGFVHAYLQCGKWCLGKQCAMFEFPIGGPTGSMERCVFIWWSFITWIISAFAFSACYPILPHKGSLFLAKGFPCLLQAFALVLNKRPALYRKRICLEW